MTMIYATGWTSLDQSALLQGKSVRATDWNEMAERLHLIFANSGTWFGGTTFDPEWETTNTSTYQTATTGSGAENLDMFHPTGRFLRELSGGYVVEFRAYGRNIDLQCTPIRYDAGGTVTPLTAFSASTSSGDSEWFTGSTTLTASDVLEHTGGSPGSDKAVFGFFFEAKKVGSNDAKLYQLDVSEKRAGSSDIPTS